MFVTMLDSVFAVPPVFDDSYYGQVIHEIREMTVMNMGNYAHGNQPIQHMIYLYDYAGQPWKAQYWLREVMNRMYTSAPDGYCGDEDNGQTSAWYVFSALGFIRYVPERMNMFSVHRFSARQPFTLKTATTGYSLLPKIVKQTVISTKCWSTAGSIRQTFSSMVRC